MMLAEITADDHVDLAYLDYQRARLARLVARRSGGRQGQADAARTDLAEALGRLIDKAQAAREEVEQ